MRAELAQLGAALSVPLVAISRSVARQTRRGLDREASGGEGSAMGPRVLMWAVARCPDARARRRLCSPGPPQRDPARPLAATHAEWSPLPDRVMRGKMSVRAQGTHHSVQKRLLGFE